MINNNFEITYFIKQLHEDYLHCAIEKTDLTYEKKLEIKKKIIETKYNIPQFVNWRKISNFDSKYTSSKIIEMGKFEAENLKYNNTPNNFSNFNNSAIDDSFYLTVTKAKINNKLIGYYFKFEKKTIDYSKNILSFPNKTLSAKCDNPPSKSINKKNESAIKRDNMNLNHIISGPNEINDKFVPHNSFVFDLDYENLAFKRLEKSDNSLNVLLKEKIMKAIEDEEKNNRKENDEEDEEENDEENEEEYDEEDESSLNIDKKDTKQMKNNFQNIFLHTEKTTSANEYYKVNLSKIHFLQFNFERNVC